MSTPAPRPQDELLDLAVKIWDDGPILMFPRVRLDAVLRAVVPEVERRVREQVAAEYRDAAQAIDDTWGHNPLADPLTADIWRRCGQDCAAGLTRDDPRSIAATAYRHLADRITREEP